MSQYEIAGNPNQPFGDAATCAARAPIAYTTVADTPLTDEQRAVWIADMQDTHRPNAKAGAGYWSE